MVRSNATNVTDYLEELDDERRSDILTVRKVIKKNLPKGYEEGMLYGMIGYYIPLERFPDTYNKQPLFIAAIASQKNYNSVYLHNVYGDPKVTRWFSERYAKSGKKLDMGQSCVRFKKANDLALDLIGEAISMTSPEEMIALHDAAHGKKKAPAVKKKPATRKKSAKKR